MNTHRPRWALAAFSLQLSAISLVLSSCGLPEPQADVVRHFTLGGEVGPGPVADATQVRPVRLAGHLHGRSLAVRVAPNEISYLEEFRWAEPLDEALTEILRARLGAVPGGATVSVEVVRFELVRPAGNSVELQADYSILPAGARRADAVRGVFKSSPRTWSGKDPAELVALMRAAADELADALAAAVAAVKPAGPG
ncbi:MAG TPA: ABC-type transport auxiliary lipoprotein family protein [Candidatus Limnocylindria bacterium]|jgi:hypothetical protein|nr:ABC-type transport auxiliary lipoprotein family protein [Candidatus Limnocylindria bacterium]HTL67182.1 ABC-type transport auxiliary lipoprotein family protein [Lacunisphaera sp.]